MANQSPGHQLDLDAEGQELYEYVADPNSGDERYLIRFLSRYVATVEELVELARHRLSIWQLLNCEYSGDFDPTPYFRAWNQRSGLPIFHRIS